MYPPSQFVVHSITARKLPILLNYSFFKHYSQDMIYSSIRLGRSSGDPTVTDLCMIQYDPNGIIYYKLNFDDELIELPGRSKKVQSISSFPNLYTSETKIPLDKWYDLQFLKGMMPSIRTHFMIIYLVKNVKTTIAKY